MQFIYFFQTSFTCVYFTEVLWPEFSAWELIYAVFYYQRCYSDLMQAKNNFINNYVLNSRTKNFVDKLHQNREKKLEEKLIEANMLEEQKLPFKKMNGFH